MRISIRHEAARTGRPVILDDAGRVVADQADGLRRVLAELGWGCEELVGRTGHSARTCKSWLWPRRPRRVPTEVLIVLANALEDKRATGRPPTAGA